MDAGDEERELLAKAAAGDPAAVRRVVDEVGPVVYGFVFARVGGDRAAADDVVQDTFLESWRGAGNYRGESRLATWMCSIARRRVMRWYDAERRQSAVVEAVAVGAGDRWDEEAALDVLPSVDDRDEVIRALGRLSTLHRQVLVLKYLDDCSVAVIAQELGRTVVQVQSLLQRARVSFRRELEVGA